MREVLLIFQNHCKDWHWTKGANLGRMIAPMSPTTYEEARPWANEIAVNAASRRMPPWIASPEHHWSFVKERALTQIEMLVAWAESTAPAREREAVAK